MSKWWEIYVILETGEQLAASVRGTEDDAWEYLDILTNRDGETYIVRPVED